MSANDKLAATFGPGRTTPTPTLETRIAEVLVDHYHSYHDRCRCGEVIIKDRAKSYNAQIKTHLAAMVAAALAPVIAEAQAEALREAADRFQVGEWFTVIQGNAHVKIGNGQRVTDWLHARAALIRSQA